MTRPFVSLTTDFGLTDPSVGICKGVILRIAPEAQIVDVSHGVGRHGIIEGASLLQAALPYLPVGVHMAVVDPGVGTDRRPVAIRTGRGDFLVGPDNGLLVPAAEVLGGVEACHELTDERYRLNPVSRTFHGRDIFAPAAGHLAAGVPLENLGPALEVLSLVPLALPAARVVEGRLDALVGSLDSFGNAQLLASQAELEAATGALEPGALLSVEAASMPAGQRFQATWRRTYGEAADGEAIVLLDSYGRLAIAVDRGNAADRYGLVPGMRLRLGRA
jgi:hypothetical protein